MKTAVGIGVELLAEAIASQGDPHGAVGVVVAGGLIGAAVNRDRYRHEGVGGALRLHSQILVVRLR